MNTNVDATQEQENTHTHIHICTHIYVYIHGYIYINTWKTASRNISSCLYMCCEIAFLDEFVARCALYLV